MDVLLIHAAPLLVLPGVAMAVLLISAWRRNIGGEYLLVFVISGLFASIFFSWKNWFEPSMSGYMLVFDKLSLAGFVLFALSAGLSLIAAYNYIVRCGLKFAEFMVLVLFAVFGAGVMAASSNLIAIFIGLETLSLSAYVLAGYNKNNSASCEAGIKYFILGAVASAILLLGIAFYFGATGTVDILPLSDAADPRMILLAAGLMIAGLGFKIAAVPFQWWTPDVYQGAPLPVTTFFATTVKAAAFIVFFRIMKFLPEVLTVDMAPLLSALAVLTMTVANVVALFQDDIKRMLAYSSIAHAGYILLAFVFLNKDYAAAQSAMLFYLLTYIVMTAGAFTVLTAVSASRQVGKSASRSESTTLSDIAGLGRASPWLAFTFTVFLLSLAGFPPTAGFFAKFYLFRAALSHGYTTIVVIAVLNSLVSVYYYMRPVVAMYFGKETLTTKECPIEYSTVGVITFSFIATILLGVAPEIILRLIASH